MELEDRNAETNVVSIGCTERKEEEKKQKLNKCAGVGGKNQCVYVLNSLDLSCAISEDYCKSAFHFFLFQNKPILVSEKSR